MPLRRIQQPPRRGGVGAHRIKASSGHLPEILVHDGRSRKLVSLGIGAEGAVSHAANMKLAVAQKKEFALNPGAQVSLSRKSRSDWALINKSRVGYIRRYSTS